MMSASTRPSRGGGGGRGGGGRGGRGRGGSSRGGGASALPMGALTWGDFAEMDKATPNRHAYPPLEDKVLLSEATDSEMRTIRLQLDFVEKQRQTSWWPTGISGLSSTTGDRNGASASTTSTASIAAVTGMKRSGAYLSRYSDKIRRLASGQADLSQHDAETANGSSSHWQNKAFLDTLQVEAFPPGLWHLFTQGETRRQERREEAANVRKRKRTSWQRVVEGVELADNDAASDGFPSDDDGIEDGDQDEYEDDVEDDYADNYFDNGEEDDVPDEGGPGEAEDVYE